ncbi:MAG: magnesium-translocating P-type ATPase [Chlamydiae bacterium]|nr:magnesium-translocating P-type ATPase [Chlamydiota bacterium]MBI3276480.1 magnesium-translocating P-type ATPase [Chlamydiota bacterium]
MTKTNKTQTQTLSFFASSPIEALLEHFNTSMGGLMEPEAWERLKTYGYNEPAKKKKRTLLWQILSKFFNPLVIVLVIVGLFSYFFGEKISAFLVFLMVLMSIFLSFIQEYRSGKEAEKLSEMVRATATILRNGRKKEVKMREIVPGDVVDLYAGDMLPADLRLISCKDLFINQASLTGESFPIEKFSYPSSSQSNSVADLTNIAFMGSSVVSGTALGLVIKTGAFTQFGELSQKLAAVNPLSSFEKGIHEFVWLMIRFMLVLVVVIFGINALLKGSLTEALLFSLAVSVGLTPEMLPMIVAVNLSKGAIFMSRKKVIVKRLSAIQNLGAMDILCTDKTGTLTLDKVVLERYCDVVRKANEEVLKLAYMNSYYQTGLKNLLDKAILKHQKLAVKEFAKFDEIPFDFSRRIMSVVVEMEAHHRIISKGAPEEIFKRCTRFELDGDIFDMEHLLLADLREECNMLNMEGFRVLAIAYKDVIEKKETYTKEDESGMVLKGYVAFLDPPKPSVKKMVDRLQRLGIKFMVLTGDNELVTKKICGDVGLDVSSITTGEKIGKLNDVELQESVKKTAVFARLDPLQKERVIRALHYNGHIVGYLGDGINDAPSLKAADVGISVDNAVDIAKESADMILLEKSLLVLVNGVLEGRKTFGNIMKYIKMGASSNLGNMISMTGASLVLPFLPMAPIQILLNNFLYDISQVAIATDAVDEEYLEKPKPWDIRAIRKFMLTLGPVSSIFDFLTFGVMMVLFKFSENAFHTGWFLESLCTQTLVIHVIRTAKTPFLHSRSSRFLLVMSVMIVTLGFGIVLSPVARYLGFVPLPLSYFAALLGMIVTYLWVTQAVKNGYVKKWGY